MSAILARRLLDRAEANGWRMEVNTGGDDDDYQGTSAARAWAAVEDVGEGYVQFRDGDTGKLLGHALLMVLGPGSCDPEESIVDHTASGPVALLCDELMAED